MTTSPGGCTRFFRFSTKKKKAQLTGFTLLWNDKQYATYDSLRAAAEAKIVSGPQTEILPEAASIEMLYSSRCPARFMILEIDVCNTPTGGSLFIYHNQPQWKLNGAI